MSETTTHEAAVSVPVMTPYRLAQVATAIAAKQGKKGEDNKPLKLSAQTLYGMSDRGALKVAKDGKGKQYVPSDEGERVIRSFLSGTLGGGKRQKVDVDAIAAAFLGEEPHADEAEPEGNEPAGDEPQGDFVDDVVNQLEASVKAATGDEPADEESEGESE